MTQKRLFGISGAIATAALIGGLLAGCMEKDLYDPCLLYTSPAGSLG